MPRWNLWSLPRRAIIIAEDFSFPYYLGIRILYRHRQYVGYCHISRAFFLLIFEHTKYEGAQLRKKRRRIISNFGNAVGVKVASFFGSEINGSLKRHRKF